MTIDVKTLDSFSLTNVSCIKIDTEGHEISVINGAINAIKASKPTTVVECKKYNLDQLRGLMTKLDYTEERLGEEDFMYTHRSRDA